MEKNISNYHLPQIDGSVNLLIGLDVKFCGTNNAFYDVDLKYLFVKENGLIKCQ